MLTNSYKPIKNGSAGIESQTRNNNVYDITSSKQTNAADRKKRKWIGATAAGAWRQHVDW